MRKKSLLCLALILVMVFSLVSCGGGDQGADTPDAGADSNADTTADTDTDADAGTDADADSDSPSSIHVGMVTSSGVDDGSFGEDCYNGVMDFLAANPDSSENHVKEPDIGKVVQAVSDVVADYDAMVLPGFQFGAIGPVAMENPDKNFIIVDGNPLDADGNEVELDNVYAMSFREQESGFFAGIVAAMETKTNKVAVVNGIAYPSNVNYQYGFMAGVNYANAHFDTTAEIVEIASYAGEGVGGNYVGDFADQAKGKIVGQALIDAGCDILFIAAGDSGNGVFAAIKESKDVYAIGCDVDQFDDGEAGGRNIILTSALKIMRPNIEKQLQNIVDGAFKGENTILGADTDSTGIVTEDGRHQMSEESVKAYEEVYTLVKDGTIVPPSFNSDSKTDDFPGL